MRLLHNTELYRVNITNSDYPSAQAFRYQNPMRLLHNTELCRVNITNSDNPPFCTSVSLSESNNRRSLLVGYY